MVSDAAQMDSTFRSHGVCSSACPPSRPSARPHGWPRHHYTSRRRRACAGRPRRPPPVGESSNPHTLRRQLASSVFAASALSVLGGPPRGRPPPRAACGAAPSGGGWPPAGCTTPPQQHPRGFRLRLLSPFEPPWVSPSAPSDQGGGLLWRTSPGGRRALYPARTRGEAARCAAGAPAPAPFVPVGVATGALLQTLEEQDGESKTSDNNFQARPDAPGGRSNAS